MKSTTPGSRFDAGLTPLNSVQLNQLLDSGSDTIDGKFVYHIQIVAKITTKKEENIRIEFDFADEAGTFKGIMFTGDDHPEMAGFEVRPDVPVEVFGQVRQFQGLTQFLVLKVRYVEQKDVEYHNVHVQWAEKHRRGEITLDVSSKRAAANTSTMAPAMDLNDTYFNKIVAAIQQTPGPFDKEVTYPELFNLLKNEMTGDLLRTKLNEMCMNGILFEGRNSGYCLSS